MSASRNGRARGPRDMTLYGIRDAELLGVVDDLADENGWTTTLGVRIQLGEPLDLPETAAGDRQRSGVGIRLAWLKRYGWLESGERVQVDTDDERGWRWSQAWRLTAMGHALLDNPKLNAAVERALENLNPAQRLALTRELGEGGRTAPGEIRNALRREWVRSAGLAPHRHQ
jgi:hypothetical protein